MNDRLIEEPFFFRNGDRSLFGVLHRPTETVADDRPAFVFCHPLGEEKLWAHRAFVAYARELAKSGHPVLRFDLTGNGDSEGSFSDLSMGMLTDDVRCAIQEVRQLTGVAAVSLLGLRLGANVAMMVAEDMPVRHLILWSPITDGERYVQELLRINLMTQMATCKSVQQERPALIAEMKAGRTVNVEGYEMGWALYASVTSIKPATQHTFGGPCLVVQIDRQARPAAELVQIAGTYPAATLQFAQEEPFWKEIATFYQQAPSLFNVTTEWLAAHESADSAALYG
jgi:exosortase A-associated hydrolase 2